MNMARLIINTAENGFIVTDGEDQYTIGKSWAFETAEALSEFIKVWGQGNTKADTEACNAKHNSKDVKKGS